MKYSIPIGVLLLVAAYMTFGIENYNYLWPSIDTKYAPDYSERAFRRVEMGMTQEEVVGLLGHPLWTKGWRSSHPGQTSAGEVWVYSSDGGASWGDWAWLSREVIFRDGRVVDRVSWTYYD